MFPSTGAGRAEADCEEGLYMCERTQGLCTPSTRLPGLPVPSGCLHSQSHLPQLRKPTRREKPRAGRVSWTLRHQAPGTRKPAHLCVCQSHSEQGTFRGPGTGFHFSAAQDPFLLKVRKQRLSLPDHNRAHSGKPSRASLEPGLPCCSSEQPHIMPI